MRYARSFLAAGDPYDKAGTGTRAFTAATTAPAATTAASDG